MTERPAQPVPMSLDVRLATIADLVADVQATCLDLSDSADGDNWFVLGTLDRIVAAVALGRHDQVEAEIRAAYESAEHTHAPDLFRADAADWHAVLVTGFDPGHRLDVLNTP